MKAVIDGRKHGWAPFFAKCRSDSASGFLGGAWCVGERGTER